MNLSGPVVKQKASFFVNFGRAETDDNELIRATVLDDNLNIVDLGTAFLTPKRNTFFSPRFDYAINNNHAGRALQLQSFHVRESGRRRIFTAGTRLRHSCNQPHDSVDRNRDPESHTINETRFSFVAATSSPATTSAGAQRQCFIQLGRRRSAIHSTNAAPGS